MKDLNAIYKETREMLTNIGIYPGRVTEVSVSRRARRRYGDCHKMVNGRDTSYRISVSGFVMDKASEDGIKQVLIHELLHTVPGCFNHGQSWTVLAEMVNDKYGYKISRMSRDEDLGITRTADEMYRYTCVCKDCGHEYHRMKRSKLIDHIERYRCGICGGVLELK